MSKVAALAAKVRALQASVDEAEGYAQACRATAARLEGPLGTLSGVTIDVAGMRSKSAKVDRTRARAESAQDVVDSARSRLSNAVGDLDGVARKYERKAAALRADLKAASYQLELAMAGGW
jgi:fructose/tagatose bisphosphate aldolase